MTFEELNLIPELQRAVEAMGFTEPTDIQAQAIPLLRAGADVIGRSQTGTGKTMAFAIPAVEMIDREEAEPTVQVLILCPTRELAQQGADEIKKLIRFMLNIWPVDVYGGAAMDRQIYRLRRANLVIGTPGRVMDHMRRGTLSLEHVKLVVLDEADEMLSMGFREDIETILEDVPESRQTVLFSATMPESILELTDRFMNDPQLIEINAEQVTLDQISQRFMEVPMGRKLDALNLLLRATEPVRCMIFCNTKLMVDEVSAYLNRSGFTCEGIHGDMNQSQRTRVMEGFKAARIPILVATDVAARGIDVSDIDYVINYDIPQNAEIYVHRIGRTGRAGKAGNAITISSGRRQFFYMRDIARSVKSDIEEIPIPTIAEIRDRQNARGLDRVREALGLDIPMEYQTMVGRLMAEGQEPAMIASAALRLLFERDETGLVDIELDHRAQGGKAYRRLLITAGRRQGVAPNHIVSCVAGRAGIPGGMIGKIEIYDERAIVGIPADKAEAVARAMEGATLCGAPVQVKLLPEKQIDRGRSRNTRSDAGRPARPEAALSDHDAARHSRSTAGAQFHSPREDAPAQPQWRGRIRLSDEAKARLLDTGDLSRFEIGREQRRESRRDSRKNHHADYERRRPRDDRKPPRKHPDRAARKGKRR